MRQVPLYDGDASIGSVPLTANLDAWDGIRWRHQQTGCHLGLGKLEDGGDEYDPTARNDLAPSDVDRVKGFKA